MSNKKVSTKATGLPKWEVRYHVNGRGSKRLGRRFDRRSDAEAFLHEIENRKRDLKRRDDGTQDFEETTFAKEADYWLSHKVSSLSPGSLKRGKGVLKALLPIYGNLSPLKFRNGRLADIQRDLLGQELSAATVNRTLSVLVAVLSLSAKHGRIPYNPSAGLEKVREIRNKISFWEEFEASDFLAFTDKKYPRNGTERWVHLSYLTALNTGLRAGELWGLKVKDLFRDGTMLHVTRQMDRVSQSLRTTKGKSFRFVPCNADLLAELRIWIAQRNLGPEDFLFQSDSGTAINHDNFRKRRFENDLRDSKVRHIRFHDLRHTAATLMVSKGVDISTVQGIMGHQSLSTTMIYVHMLGTNIQRAANIYSIGPAIKIAATDASEKPKLAIVR